MSKRDLTFDKPIMNVAGMLGFAPDIKGPVDISQLGAFITNPVSRRARKPVQGTRFVSYPGGFLLHTGLPNPGLNAVIRRYAKQWAHSPVPVIVHLLAQEPDELAWMVERLEGIEGVMGIEIGLPPKIETNHATDLAMAALGELPVVVRLPLKGCDLAPAVIDAGVSAVSLGAPRGSLPAEDGRLISGRLYGPGVFPLALQAVETLSERGIPVIGAGGVYQASEVDTMLNAGAIAVQLDAVLWRGW
ncbi:MAG: hypothetical protein AB1345_13325 [Chloroflexota bacterium]